MNTMTKKQEAFFLRVLEVAEELELSNLELAECLTFSEKQNVYDFFRFVLPNKHYKIKVGE